MLTVGIRSIWKQSTFQQAEGETWTAGDGFTSGTNYSLYFTRHIYCLRQSKETINGLIKTQKAASPYRKSLPSTRCSLAGAVPGRQAWSLGTRGAWDRGLPSACSWLATGSVFPISGNTQCLKSKFPLSTFLERPDAWREIVTKWGMKACEVKIIIGGRSVCPPYIKHAS